MGMTGMVFVRPKRQDGTSRGTVARERQHERQPDGVPLQRRRRRGPGSTAYDREFSMFLSEVWAEAHWADAHIQLPEWSDYRADFALLNGRVYPDTIAPNGPGVEPLRPRRRDVRHERRPHRAGRAPGAAVPADLLARELRRGRAGGPAVLQPRVPRVGDDDRRAADAGRRPRRHPDAGPGRHRHLVRDRHPQHRPRRELRRHLHRPGQGRDGPYDTYFLYNRSFSRSNNLGPTAASVDRRRRSGSTPRVMPRPRRTGLPERLGVLGMSTTTAPCAVHCGAPPSSPSALSWPSAATAAASAPPRPPTRPAQRDRLHDRRAGAATGKPVFDLTTRTGYIDLPDGNTAFMWGYSSGFDAFQHPGPVLCVHEGDKVTVILHNTLAGRRPRSSSPGRTTCAPTASRRSPRSTPARG